MRSLDGNEREYHMKSTEMRDSDLFGLAATCTMDAEIASATFRTKVMGILPMKRTATALSGDAQVTPVTLVIDAALFGTKNEKWNAHLRSEDNANRAGAGVRGTKVLEVDEADQLVARPGPVLIAAKRCGSRASCASFDARLVQYK
jgi:hypothetical protein